MKALLTQSLKDSEALMKTIALASLIVEKGFKLDWCNCFGEDDEELREKRSRLVMIFKEQVGFEGTLEEFCKGTGSRFGFSWGSNVYGEKSANFGSPYRNSCVQVSVLLNRYFMYLLSDSLVENFLDIFGGQAMESGGRVKKRKK